VGSYLRLHAGPVNTAGARGRVLAIVIRDLLTASCVCAALAASPAPVAAQQRVFVEALSEFTDAIAGTSGDEGPRIGLALDRMTRALAEWDRSAAKEVFGAASALDTADEIVIAPVAYQPGYARLARGEYHEAIDAFRLAAATDPLVIDPAAASPDSSEAHRIRGLTYWMHAQDDTSIEQLEIAIRKNPRDERSRIALARVLGSAGREPDAERVLQETLQVLPESALARWWLGWGYERLNRFADARQEYERASAGVVTGRSRVYALLGRLAASAADIPGAVEAFGRAVTTNPNDPILHEYLAIALLQQGRTDDAFAEFVAALLIDPLNARAHAGIGRIHLDAGRYGDAVTALRRSVELSASDAEARYALASALMRSGKTQEAAQEFERAAEALRQALADRRRNMRLDVLKEEAALGAPRDPSR